MRGERLIVLVLILTAGCVSPTRPDLHRLYAFDTGAENPPPVVLIHGFMASKLRDRETGEQIWPGSAGHAAATGYLDLALEIDPETLEPLPSSTEPFALAPLAGDLGLDDHILDVLSGPGGYSAAEPGSPVTGSGQKRYYVFLYDWRQDNVDTVRRLDGFLSRIRVDYSDPKLQVDVIAHGMGGLVIRYYMRYGTLDVLDDNEFPVNHYGAQFVRRVILLGVPNLGTTAAVEVFAKGRQAAHGRAPAEVFVTMPSLYQVLPHPISGSLVGPAGEGIAEDLFESAVWRRFRWAIYDPEIESCIRQRFPTEQEADAYLEVLDRYFDKRIERARRFVWSLTVPAPKLVNRYVVFGGDCELTSARILVEPENNAMAIRLFPEDVESKFDSVDYERLMLEPGDGTITKSSLLARHALNPAVPRHKHIYFPLDYSLFLCEGHATLTANIHFQNNLLNVLLRADER